MRVPFTKMHGLGNDFVVLDQLTQNHFIGQKKIKELSDRKRGIGFDQLIFIEPPTTPEVDFNFRVFNADGQEIEHCGNGARCFYRYVRDKRLTWKKNIKVSTELGHVLEMSPAPHGMVSVSMVSPNFKTEQIPITLEQNNNDLIEVTLKNETYELGMVSMGNPHCVLLVPDINVAPVKRLGQQLRIHPHFPEQVNVGFMEVVTPTRVKLRVYERGVGETLACGTGACAAVAVGIQQGWLQERARVELQGGYLHIKWKGDETPMIMTGPAESVFEGHLEL